MNAVSQNIVYKSIKGYRQFNNNTGIEITFLSYKFDL